MAGAGRRDQSVAGTARQSGRGVDGCPCQELLSLGLQVSGGVSAPKGLVRGLPYPCLTVGERVSGLLKPLFISKKPVWEEGGSQMLSQYIGLSPKHPPILTKLL